MHDPRDIKLDVAGLSPAGSEPASASGRPFLSVRFDCCRVYQRIYRDPAGHSYTGRCPRCGKPVRFAVGDGGTASRAFIVR